MIDLFCGDIEKAEELKHFFLHTSEAAHSSMHIKWREKYLFSPSVIKEKQNLAA